jgi:hypothetical protein
MLTKWWLLQVQAEAEQQPLAAARMGKAAITGGAKGIFAVPRLLR